MGDIGFGQIRPLARHVIKSGHDLTVAPVWSLTGQH
jgi:hypothetical protein